MGDGIDHGIEATGVERRVGDGREVDLQMAGRLTEGDLVVRPEEPLDRVPIREGLLQPLR